MKHLPAALILYAMLSIPAPAATYPATLPDPAKLPSSPKPPDALVCLDGTKVTSRQTWEAKRKPELNALFQHYMYGTFPPRPREVTCDVVREEGDYFDGKATLKEVTIRYGPKGTPPIRLLVVAPASSRTKPAPVFVGLNFNGNHAVLDDPEIALPAGWMREGKGVENNRATDAGRGKDVGVWNVEYVIDRGYAVATFYSGDVDPDKDDPTDGVQPHFRKAGISREGPDEWATLAAWAYGIHRAVDYLETDPAIDKTRIACVGHSRNGKTALLAAAFDDRIDLAIPHQAGCGGTAPSRGTVGESVKQINTGFPHWFDGHFKYFNEHVDQLPFDQHCLIALCAPRPVLLSNAVEDQWANPAGQFEMLKLASPVYELLGVEEALAADSMPETGKLVDSPLGYWIRPGKHAMTLEDWEIFLRFADKHLGRRER